MNSYISKEHCDKTKTTPLVGIWAKITLTADKHDVTRTSVIKKGVYGKGNNKERGIRKREDCK